jgi:hypothetical protein
MKFNTTIPGIQLIIVKFNVHAQKKGEVPGEVPPLTHHYI